MAVRLDHNSPPGVSYRALALLTRPARCIVNPVSGGDSGGETPVPISNTAVKPSSADGTARRSEEHTSELQSRPHLVCRLLLEKKKKESEPNIVNPLIEPNTPA